MHSIVVVGGGAAGVAAAEALRREGYGGSLVLLGDEPVLPYDRPPLSKQVLTGAWDYERTRLRTRQHYADLGISLRHGEACGLDTWQRLIQPFWPLPYFWTDQYEVKIQVHGEVPDGGEVTFAEGAPGGRRFVALCHQAGQLTGVLGWNAPARLLPCRKQLLDQQAPAA